MNSSQNNISYAKALELMRNASSINGFLASTQQTDNYARVWTRDGVICGIASLASGEMDLIGTFRTTLQTIFNHQHAYGFIPSNVSLNGETSYGGIVGRVDNPSWAIIGLCLYAKYTNDFDFASQYVSHVEKAFAVMNAWEFNAKHLIYSPISSNWADEYIQQGYVLFDQLLRLYALRLAGTIFKNDAYLRKAQQITHVVEHNFWKHEEAKNLYSVSLSRMYHLLPQNQWCMGFSPNKVFTQFDLQSQSLALILGLGSDTMQQAVINTISKKNAESHQMIASFNAIEELDEDYKLLENNYAYEFRNKPYHFHNGGLWPVWNGIAALAVHPYKPKLSIDIENAISHANSLSSIEGDTWQFNECIESKEYKPNGIPYCTWSAAGSILAHTSNQTIKRIKLHEN